MKLNKVIKISRPRFWLYEFGTFLFFGVFVGILYLNNSFILQHNLLNILVFGFYFLFPANLLIYGINDVYDYETDILNPRKKSYEALVTPNESRILWFYILITNLPFLIYSLTISIKSLITFILFLFFAIFYSAPPIRAKTKPFFDSFFSASHYVMTAVFGFVLITNEIPNYFIVLAGMFWAIAMHAYSAIPDIKFDTESNIETIATKLKAKKTILLCVLLYLFSAIILAKYFFITAIILGIFYTLIMIYTYNNLKKIDYIYTFFPYINIFSGMVISLQIISLIYF